MKKMHLWAAIAAVIVLTIAILSAMNMGEKSPLFAEGHVILSDDLKESARGIRTLFIIIHDADSPMPMPYGTLRKTLSDDVSGDFYHFVLTKESVQVMMPDRPVPKRLKIKARLDLDGAGGMDSSGDLVGMIDSIPLGAKDLTLKIDRLIK